jgi:cobyrinic acid a,c-diamide synthase
VRAAGLIIAAPASGQGKTTLTLGLIAALGRQGHGVRSFKVGPDYIDPAFHEAASGRSCLTLDPWAMRAETLDRLAGDLFADAPIVIGEGVMGLFDGAPDGTGSTADLAARLALPVVLVIDASRQGASIAALAEGFMRHRADVSVAGVILNRVGSPSHEAVLRRALAGAAISVLGAVPRDDALALPSRHLGLVQAREHATLASFIAAAATVVERRVDLPALRSVMRPARLAPAPEARPPLPPLGQRIAVAHDDAFAFLYPHVLEGWRRAGATLTYFSPLADEAPAADSDALYLPGGYPELHAGRIASAERFKRGLHDMASRDAAIYGECGGYMTLGDGLVDAEGARHAMAGLLPLETSFAVRRLHLGYRRVELAVNSPLGATGDCFKGHEFHYATILREGGDDALFTGRDGRGQPLGPLGRRKGRVFGSFIHLIDRGTP